MGVLAPQFEPIVAVELPVEGGPEDEPLLIVHALVHLRSASLLELSSNHGLVGIVAAICVGAVLAGGQVVVVVERHHTPPTGVGSNVVDQLVIDREVVEVEGETEAAEEEAAGRIPAVKLALPGEHPLERAILLIRQVRIERQGPLARLAQILSPVQGQVVVAELCAGKIDRIRNRQIVEPPALRLAAECRSRRAASRCRSCS